MRGINGTVRASKTVRMARGRNRKAVSEPKTTPATARTASDAAFSKLFGLDCAAAEQSLVLRQVCADVRDQLLADIAHRLLHKTWPCDMQVLRGEFVSVADEDFGYVSVLDTTGLRDMPDAVLADLHAKLFCSRVDLSDYNRPLSSVLRTECCTK